MNQWLLEPCQRIAETKGSIALHESLYVYPFVETIHVLGLGLFLGTLFMVDFRLLGWSFHSIPLAEISKRILPYSLLGFGIMFITGVLLFYAIPVRTFQSVFFRVKIILLLIAGINALRLHLKMRKAGNVDVKVSNYSKAAAITSLLTWCGVIIAGRMIAYNWFDCDKTNLTEIIIWFSGCDDTI